MTEKECDDFDKENVAIIYKLLRAFESNSDDTTRTIIATIAQFLISFRQNINQKCKNRPWVTSDEIIDSQVEELRQCIIDLETAKERLTKGVTVQ